MRLCRFGRVLKSLLAVSQAYVHRRILLGDGFLPAPACLLVKSHYAKFENSASAVEKGDPPSNLRSAHIRPQPASSEPQFPWTVSKSRTCSGEL